MAFKIGDRVRSIGLITRDYGIGTVIATKLKVATVQFNNQSVESFHFAMLEEAKDA